jgi:maltose alpha-D-glucosyltransferase / alpha-amylase
MLQSRIVSKHPWYKDAVFYEIYVRGFFDSNGDGVGDLNGLTEKLDYLKDLGIDCLWLLPIYPSPRKDDGYDIADFCSVAAEYGTLADFDRFLEGAHARGIRVILDLVLNHVSSEHPWFVSARSSRESPYRDYFVWSDTTERYREVRIIFSDALRSNWTFDDVAGQHYWHRFFPEQPDLNFDNLAVQDEVIAVADFWLARGVDGFRCDAVPYLFEREGTSCESLPETHSFLKRMRAHIDARYTDRVLIAEANQWPEDLTPYFEQEFHMAFHFPLMPRMFMALRKESALPIAEIFARTPAIPADCQWGIFLRNHDELTLEMVTDSERDYLYREYAKDPQMRLNAGIRRRLSPLLSGSRRRVELLHALLLSLPGSPFLYYGDEIGMGDSVYLGDRNGVRTPMQWSGDSNAGFSRAEPARLYSPVSTDAAYHFQSVNVAVQESSESSLLQWVRRLLHLRRKNTAFGRGAFRVLKTSHDSVLAFERTTNESKVVIVANLSRFVAPVHIEMATHKGCVPCEMIGGALFPQVSSAPYFVSLGPHSFYWFQMEDIARGEAHE